MPPSWGFPRKEILEKTDDAIDFAGLQKFEDTKLKNISSGMQVRLAFSTAIQTDPDAQCHERFGHRAMDGIWRVSGPG
jgi:ABC-type polysaccharide/polyol phosphate transport system ATPase subunit